MSATLAELRGRAPQVSPPSFDDAAFARSYAALTVPAAAATALPSPTGLVVAVVLVAVGWVIDREVRIRWKAARPLPAAPQLSVVEDSSEDSRGQLERTAA